MTGRGRGRYDGPGASVPALLAAEMEYEDTLPRAQAGNRAAMRRVGELLDLLGRDAQALVWWRRAAKAGDREAVHYLEERGT